MISFLVALLGSFGAMLLLGYLRLRTIATSEYARSARDFFDIASKLVQVDDAPAELFEIVDALNETIADKHAAGSLLSYFTDETRWKGNHEDAARRKKALAEYFRKRPEIESLYREMIVSWFLAVTALSPLRGKLARWAMTEGAVEAAASRPRRRSLGGDFSSNSGHPAHA